MAAKKKGWNSREDMKRRGLFDDERERARKAERPKRGGFRR